MTVTVPDQPNNDPALPIYGDVLLPLLQTAIQNGEKYVELFLTINPMPAATVAYFNQFGITFSSYPAVGGYYHVLTWGTIVGELPFGGFWLVDQETRLK